jgi:hypothetical protein
MKEIFGHSEASMIEAGNGIRECIDGYKSDIHAGDTLIMSLRQQWMLVILFVLQKTLLTSLHSCPLLRPLENYHMPKLSRPQVAALSGKEERNSRCTSAHFREKL